jgi:uncharacterized protein (TIGR02266 family)
LHRPRTEGPDAHHHELLSMRQPMGNSWSSRCYHLFERDRFVREETPMHDQGGSGGAERRAHPRVPLHAEVRIVYPNRARLFTEVCGNVSVGGMFVESPVPVEIGTVVRFELDLAPLNASVQGVGEVVWRREGSLEAGRGSGFGIRFVEVDPQELRLIYRIVDRFILGGGQPFDLENREPKVPSDQ